MKVRRYSLRARAASAERAKKGVYWTALVVCSSLSPSPSPAAAPCKHVRCDVEEDEEGVGDGDGEGWRDEGIVVYFSVKEKVVWKAVLKTTYTSFHNSI